MAACKSEPAMRPAKKQHSCKENCRLRWAWAFWVLQEPLENVSIDGIACLQRNCIHLSRLQFIQVCFPTRFDALVPSALDGIDVSSRFLRNFLEGQRRTCIAVHLYEHVVFFLRPIAHFSQFLQPALVQRSCLFRSIGWTSVLSIVTHLFFRLVRANCFGTGRDGSLHREQDHVSYRSRRSRVPSRVWTCVVHSPSLVRWRTHFRRDQQLFRRHLHLCGSRASRRRCLWRRCRHHVRSFLHYVVQFVAAEGEISPHRMVFRILRKRHAPRHTSQSRSLFLACLRLCFERAHERVEVPHERRCWVQTDAKMSVDGCTALVSGRIRFGDGSLEKRASSTDVVRVHTRRCMEAKGREHVLVDVLW